MGLLFIHDACIYVLHKFFREQAAMKLRDEKIQGLEEQVGSALCNPLTCCLMASSFKFYL